MSTLELKKLVSSFSTESTQMLTSQALQSYNLCPSYHELGYATLAVMYGNLFWFHLAGGNLIGSTPIGT